MKTIKKIITISLATALTLSMTGCAKDKNTDKDISVPILETQNLEFNTTKAEVGTISQRYSLSGLYANPYTTTITFEQSGEIEEIYYKQDTNVKKGDILVKIKSEELEDQISEQEIRVNAAEKTLANLKKSGSDSIEISIAEIDFELEKNTLNALEKELEKSYVYAPHDGVINNANYYYFDDNQIVKRCEKRDFFGFMTDTDTSVLCGVVYGSELSDVRFGTEVNISQGDTRDIKGTVTDIINTGVVDTRVVYVVTPNDKGIVFSGSDEIEINITVSEKSDVVIVPNDVIKQTGERVFVYIVVDGIRIETDVETGLVDNLLGITEITSGLNGTETLVLN
ncbi:MAG: biotin/lipoyl-binding protein [Clostridiales bacterium]|nr:biotin/lipoyl-binding protein [Clostridiales bacterium]